MKVTKWFKGITRNVVLLGLVSLFTDLSSQMVFPLIPLFLSSVLGAGAYAVGIVEGMAETTASLLKIFSGYWSDKTKKRKPFVIAGYSLSTITKPLFALANSWPLVLGARIIERIGKGLRSAPRDAIVAESSSLKERGKAYGFQRALDGTGSLLGALMAAALLPMLGFRNIFLIAFVPGIIAVLLILPVREKKQKLANKSVPLRVGLKELSPALRWYIVAAAIFALGHFGYAFLLLKAKEAGFSNEKAILLYAMFYSIYVVFSMIAGSVSDRIGRKKVLVAGYVLFGIMSLWLVGSAAIVGVVVAFAVYGIVYAMIDGSQRAFVVDLAPKELKATALGTFYTINGLVALPGGFIAGLLWDLFGSGATFLYGFGLSMVAALVLGVAVKKADKSLKQRKI